MAGRALKIALEIEHAARLLSAVDSPGRFSVPVPGRLGRRQQAAAVRERGAQATVGVAELDLGCVDPVPAVHPERLDPAFGQQRRQPSDPAARHQGAVVDVVQQRGDGLDGIGLVGPDDAGRTSLHPAGDVLVSGEPAVADHPSFGVRDPPGAGVGPEPRPAARPGSPPSARRRIAREES